jgi:hypothetical protein
MGSADFWVTKPTAALFRLMRVDQSKFQNSTSINAEGAPSSCLQGIGQGNRGSPVGEERHEGSARVPAKEGPEGFSVRVVSPCLLECCSVFGTWPLMVGCEEGCRPLVKAHAGLNSVLCHLLCHADSVSLTVRVFSLSCSSHCGWQGGI